MLIQMILNGMPVPVIKPVVEPVVEPVVKPAIESVVEPSRRAPKGIQLLKMPQKLRSTSYCDLTHSLAQYDFQSPLISVK